MEKKMKVVDIIKRCREVYEDIEFNYVRKWIDERSGAKAIGYLPIYMPREIVYAAGMLPVGIMGAGDMLEIIKGDSYYQSYICHIPRSSVEMALDGKLDCLSGMVFPSICDVVRNLSGVWKLLFPENEKYSWYLDLPQNFDPNIGGKFYQVVLKEFISDLETLSGKTIEVNDLNHSISLYNQNRRYFRELCKIRAEKPWLVPLGEYYLLNRAGSVMDVEEHNELLSDYIGGIKSLKRKPLDNIRVVLLGCFCEQPPLGLVKTIEMAGCYVVWDDFVIGNRFIESDIDASTDDPIKAISDGFLFGSTFSSSKYEINELGINKPKSELLVEIIRNVGVDGVILTGPSFCDPILLDHPGYMDAFDKENIPYITFQYSEDMAQYQVIDEEVGTFSDSIRLWR